MMNTKTTYLALLGNSLNRCYDFKYCKLNSNYSKFSNVKFDLHITSSTSDVNLYLDDKAIELFEESGLLRKKMVA